MRNKIFTKIIITTLLVTFLTFNVGRVNHVSAVATTGSIAAAALLATGVVFVSYLALTGATVEIADDVESWLTDIGGKVSQYTSGHAIYQKLYEKALTYPLNPLQILDDAWTWTSEDLVALTNDFSNTEVLQRIVSFTRSIDTTYIARNGFNYGSRVVHYPNQFRYNRTNIWNVTGIAPIFSTGVKLYSSPNANSTTSNLYIQYLNLYSQVRNVLKSDGRYYPEYLNNGVWTSLSGSYAYGYYITTDHDNNVYQAYQSDYWEYFLGTMNWSINSSTVYPVFPDAPIYVQATGETLPMVDVQDEVEVLTPDWVGNYNGDDEDDKRPIIPYTKLPNNGNWGFNLQDLLDTLEDVATTMIDIGIIGDLINAFKDLHSGDTTYIYYGDGYYNYYTITSYDNDYVTYNINVSEVDEHLPVDLNTIQNYSNNRYLDQIKQSAINGSSIVRDLAVFWYDVDPEVTYIALGICIVILIGAFTGKLGHS